jgi:mRNA-degrading endonuclease YafQ of YafQ-DinJ toxin-antitoxin module
MQNKSKFRISYSAFFKEKFKKLPEEIKTAFLDTQDLFLENPHHFLLRRHQLNRNYAGFESIDITNDYRALFKEEIKQTEIKVKFYNIGTHKELYGELAY